MIVIIELFKEPSFLNTGVDASSSGKGLKPLDISRSMISETESLREKLELTLDGDGAKDMNATTEFEIAFSSP